MMTSSVTGHRLKVFVAKVMTCGASPSGGGGGEHCTKNLRFFLQIVPKRGAGVIHISKCTMDPGIELSALSKSP